MVQVVKNKNKTKQQLAFKKTPPLESLKASYTAIDKYFLPLNVGYDGRKFNRLPNQICH